jgi:hypothetical protein
VTETAVEPLTPVPDPDTVTLYVPVAVEVVGLTVKVTDEVEGIFTDAELKEQVAPVGHPLVTAKSTTPVNPPDGVTVMVLLPEEPCFTEKLEGEAEREMPGGTDAFTVKETVVELVKLPLEESTPVTPRLNSPVFAEEVFVTVKLTD